MASETNPSSDVKPAEPEKIWYEAVCHCTAVRYRCQLPAQLKVCRCNCSVCTKLGYLLVYPKKEDTQWISGYDKLVNYRFGPKIQDHKFCSVCGSSIGIDSMNYKVKHDVWRFNLRLFKNIDLSGPNITYWDCNGRDEIYAEFNDPERM